MRPYWLFYPIKLYRLQMGLATATGTKGQLCFGSRKKRVVPVMAILQAGTAIHHFALLLFKNYLTIQVGTLQRIHHQYNRYESALDDTLIGIESLSSGHLIHHILDPKTLSRYLVAIADDIEDMAPDYEPVFTDVYQYYGNSIGIIH